MSGNELDNQSTSYPKSQDTSDRQEIYMGMLLSAMRAGTTYQWLRDLLRAGENLGHPVEKLYQQAREQASLVAGVQVPSLETLRNVKQGVLQNRSQTLPT